MAESMYYFSHNIAPRFWIVGLIFGVILLIGYFVQKKKDKDFDRLQEQKKIENLQRLKNKKSVVNSSEV